MRQAEQAFRHALLERTPERSPLEWAAIQNSLGNALQSLGEHAGDAATFRQAEQAFRNALLERTRERSPMGWAGAQNNLGNVLLRLGEIAGDVAVLRQAERALREALLEFTRVKVPLDWATTQNNLGNVLHRLGTLSGDVAVLRQAEQAFCDALLERTRARLPMDWAATHINLGAVLRSLGDLAGDAAILRKSEQAYRDALAEFTRARRPMEWAAVHLNLGNVLLNLGALTGDAAVLRQAEQAFRDAMLEYTRARSPMDWANTQNGLGNVLEALSAVTGDASILRQAEQAFRDALLARTRERAPADWAETQTNLGNVLHRLGAITGDAAVLRQGEQALRDALMERDRKHSPMDWATTQISLGAVLQSLGELAGDAATLHQAERAFRGALRELIRERAPMAWAMIQNNLGNVLEILGELTGDISVLRRAEQAFRRALLEYTRERNPINWARTKNNLGNVLEGLGALTGDADVLRQAERTFRDALLEFTRARAPMEWATSQNNRGAVLRRLGDLTGDAAVLHQAEQAYRDALLECTRARSPMGWAMTQTNLGTVLQRMGELSGDTTDLHQAEQAFRDADLVLQDSVAEDAAQRTRGRLAALLVRLGRFDEAAQLIGPAIARSDIALIDATRSHDGRARVIEVVSNLHGLLSLCHLHCSEPNISAAFKAAASGRARLLADALAFDGAGVELINDPEVREEIEHVTARRRELKFQLGYDRADSTSTPRELAPAHRARLQAELHEASEAWATLLRRHGLIRTLPTLDPTDIQAAVPDGGALVLPVLTEHGAFTFVVTENGQLAVIELPGLDRGAVDAHLSGETNWLGVYNRYFREHQGKDPAAAAAWKQQLTGTLAWLWERLLTPIHVHLRDVVRLAPNAPVVLLPPGLLGLLPLHAAGPGPDGRYFGDHWTVSYAPSVRSLLTCQARRDARAFQPARLLAAIDPDGTLSGARAEGPMLQQRFAAPGREPVILTGEEATIARVLGALADATVFHASTHGTHDWMEPARSGLLLADGVLQLDMLRYARLDAMRLVFLSACESGLAGVRKLPEEFIGLPTGLVEAGAAAVVGSLWPIGDTSAFLLARRFYDLMFDAAGQERVAPATALREACAWLRGVTFGELKQEFPLMHLASGPALVLRSARMMPGTLEPDRPAPPEAPHLPLGPDDERPFAHPTHWAAFTATGC